MTPRKPSKKSQSYESPLPASVRNTGRFYPCDVWNDHCSILIEPTAPKSTVSIRGLFSGFFFKAAKRPFQNELQDVNRDILKFGSC
jgi:hypothetical protein